MFTNMGRLVNQSKRLQILELVNNFTFNYAEDSAAGLVEDSFQHARGQNEVSRAVRMFVQLAFLSLHSNTITIV